MYEVGWCVELGQEGLRVGGGNCLKYLERRWNRKKGRGNKDFKMGGASWVKGWVLLKEGEGCWNSLTNYDNYFSLPYYTKKCRLFNKV